MTQGTLIPEINIFHLWLQTNTCWSLSAEVNVAIPPYIFAEQGPAYRNVAHFGSFSCMSLHFVHAHVS